MAAGIRLPACLLAAVLGCSHGEPFTPADQGTDVPFASGSPRRLTFSPADDRTASWLPDGSGIIYSSERADRRDADRCLQILPPNGGSVRRTICNPLPAYDDSTDRWESPAVNADGRIVYYRAVGWIGLQKGPQLRLMLGRLEDPAAAVELTRVPYFATNGKVHSNVSQIRWLAPSRFVYLAEELFYEGSTFYPDTFMTGRDIVHGEVTGETATLTVVHGTDDASSVAVGDDGDTIYFTLGGDTRVYRRALSTGEQTVLHDFGAAGIVRDVQVHGSTLVAVVGRSVHWSDELAHGWVQRDEGGDLAVVDLATGVMTLVSYEETLFRRPAISPDGTRVVVEASPYAPPHLIADSEYNATNHRPDLWLFDLQ
jgi:hypothetical protein